jgi:transcriptional regulator with XRE-family HTH domain
MQQIDKENLKKLGLKIKQERTKKSKSLNKFALQKGFVTPATQSRIENGLVDLKFSTLLKIAHMLETEPSALLKDIDFNYNFEDE